MNLVLFNAKEEINQKYSLFKCSLSNLSIQKIKEFHYSKWLRICYARDFLYVFLDKSFRLKLDSFTWELLPNLNDYYGSLLHVDKYIYQYTFTEYGYL